MRFWVECALLHLTVAHLSLLALNSLLLLRLPDLRPLVHTLVESLRISHPKLRRLRCFRTLLTLLLFQGIGAVVLCCRLLFVHMLKKLAVASGFLVHMFPAFLARLVLRKGRLEALFLEKGSNLLKYLLV